jgi:hypothetical protein
MDSHLCCPDPDALSAAESCFFAAPQGAAVALNYYTNYNTLFVSLSKQTNRLYCHFYFAAVHALSGA